MQWFDTPTFTDFEAIDTNTVPQLAAADPQRVLLWIIPAQNEQRMLTPAPQFASNTDIGIKCGNGSDQPGGLLLTQDKHGPLCQMPWYCVPDGTTADFLVIELRLKAWPSNQYGSSQ